MEEIKEMDFQVITELPVVVFNVEELKSQALALVERYDGLVFTEEEIPAVRKDMAMLNTLAERLERARIDTAKQMMAPIKEFEAQVKDVSAILLKTREVLGEKVQVFVQQQKEIRRAAVLLAIEDVRAKYMAFCSALEVPLRETWLAKSTSMISVKSDISDIFAAHTKAMEAAAALIVAKNERVQAIEAKAAGLEAQHGFVLPRMGFAPFLEISVPLMEAYASMDRVYMVEGDRRAEAARIAAEKAERERVERERQEAVKAERERVEAQRLADEEQRRRDLEHVRVSQDQARLNEAAEHRRLEEEAERISAERAAAEKAERERLGAERIARLDAEAERNRVETPSDAEMAAKQASFVTTPAQAATLQREGLAPRKDGPPFDHLYSHDGADDTTQMTALEALKALVQEIKGGTLLMGVKTSKAFHDAVAVIKAGGM